MKDRKRGYFGDRKCKSGEFFGVKSNNNDKIGAMCFLDGMAMVMVIGEALTVSYIMV